MEFDVPPTPKRIETGTEIPGQMLWAGGDGFPLAKGAVMVLWAGGGGFPWAKGAVMVL